MPTSVAPTVTPASPASSHKKFSTFAGLRELSSRGGTHHGTSANSSSNRTSIRGLFDEDGNPSSVTASPRMHGGELESTLSDPAAAATLSRSGDAPWSISVAEAKDRREGRKRKQIVASYTLYVTTPTHNLTLVRSSNEITHMDSKVRDGLSHTCLPALPNLPTSAPQLSGRTFFQTISRTLSPGASRSRASFTNFAGEPTSSAADANRSGAVSPPPSAPLSPLPEAMSKLASHSTTTQLATYFTALANNSATREHKAWKRFVRVGLDDLQSVRVERRVRKVRSDLAEHVKSSVAPRNTNVGVAPAQTDLEEDGGPTEDDVDLDSADESSRASSTPAGGLSRATVNSRSGSMDTASSDRRAAADDSRSTNTNIEMIPEEQNAEDSEVADTEREGDAAKVHRSRSHRHRKGSNKVTVDDFEMIRVLGKGCAGKVLLVRHSSSRGLYAMKSIHKRHVLAHQELQHTLTEQAVLKRMAKDVLDPFVVRLWWSFHDRNNLYLVMDFHPGGDLATQLSRWGRLGRDRARFYAAEIVEGVEGLHKAGVIYRDLKPENVLIGADGHIVLSDFGLSKEFSSRRHSIGSVTPPPTSPGRSHSSTSVAKSRSAHWMSASDDASDIPSRSSSTRWLEERETTTTFCGTAEYLAPEVLQGQPYSYEVDWWSFGTMLYEMLTGITPFWADTHADMYAKVLRDPLVFPEDRVLDQDTKSILRGLLQRNPQLRMKEPRIKKHPYFSMIEWDHIFHKRYIPPYIPPIDPDNEIDTQNFDETFLEMQPTVAHEVDSSITEAAAGEPGVGDMEGDMPVDGIFGQNGVAVAAATPDESMDDREASQHSNLFDGYSFRGRKDSESINSILSNEQPDDVAADDAAMPASPVKEAAQQQAQEPLTTSAAAATTATTMPPAITAVTAKATSKVTRTQVQRQAVAAVPSSTQLPVADVSVAEEEDDEAAARAAAAVLAQLEHEASVEASSIAGSSAAEPLHSDPVQPHSREATTNTSDSQSDHSASQIQSSPASSYASRSAVPRKMAPSAVGRPSNGAIRESDHEDDDWDMVELSGPDGKLKSELNGGKGTNLFARGVVDTYRLLRRQESSRIPPSSSHSSTTGRPFNRLGKRRNGQGIMMRSKASFGELTTASSLNPVSVEGDSDKADAIDKAAAKLTAPLNGRLSALSASSNTELNRRSAASPSLSGSEETKHQARLKKIKRFTTFFEPASHRS
ncbi:probable serine/threonine protein kinase B-related Ukb1 [Melanopsichium pennsylvanicum]|uniref:non-specific serine/threonine protein kinase n=2 Tax=Melanopsichium pennsylvanicum TaxID=63383 RepID=A0AAJ4XN68_9BASI|nr:serine/threonine protein kinase B-related Ukb1 [Melanopsichium pennsylvanicum 4]SNX84912.1 probable serine/threonine protein kinase B-related Ukb1 [Melanopsichium pennsylvanicum]